MQSKYIMGWDINGFTWTVVQKGIVRWDINGFTWTVVQKGIVRRDIDTHGLTWTTNYTERSNNNGVR